LWLIRPVASNGLGPTYSLPRAVPCSGRVLGWYRRGLLSRKSDAPRARLSREDLDIVRERTHRDALGPLLPRLLAHLGLPACRQPAHRPLSSARPGRGLWYLTQLRLPCPDSGGQVEHRGHLRGPVAADRTPPLPPDGPAPSAPAVSSSSFEGADAGDGQPDDRVFTATDDGSGQASCDRGASG
jgi:hypothetical protein